MLVLEAEKIRDLGKPSRLRSCAAAPEGRKDAVEEALLNAGLPPSQGLGPSLS